MLRDVLEHTANSAWPIISLIIFVVCFLGVVWWTYSGRRDRFQRDSRLPLDDANQTTHPGDSTHER